MWVPSDSDQATYGTPLISAIDGTPASCEVDMFKESPTAVQLPASNRLTRSW